MSAFGAWRLAGPIEADGAKVPIVTREEWEGARMSRPWLGRGLAILALAAGALAAPAGQPTGCLTGPVLFTDGVVRPYTEPYQPRAGDLVVYGDNSVVWRVLFALAWTGPPFHAGIVVELADGRPAVLEAGPYDRQEIRVMELLPRFLSHDGTIWVRRLRSPLSPENTRRLAEFAQAQTVKPYATGRLILEGTPFRAHGPVGERLFGSSRLDRANWFCSELAMAAAAVAGLIDPHAIKPNTVYPRDIFRDRPHDLSRTWEGPALWSETAPAPTLPVGGTAPGR
jgi:hypothetical protein